jgi:dynein heavy chain
LTKGLANENARWKLSVIDLKAQTTRIVGDVLLAAAFVSYIPAFSAPFRLKLWLETWYPSILNQKIPITEEIKPIEILTNSAEMAQWANEDLPNDPMSLENAAVIVSCTRWPLLIDP